MHEAGGGGAPTFPLVAPLSFTLSRRVTSLCIMERGAPAPTSVTALASRCPRCLIGRRCHQSYAAGWGLAFGSAVRLRSHLGPYAVRKVEIYSKTCMSIYERCKVLDPERSVFARRRRSSARREMKCTPAK